MTAKVDDLLPTAKELLEQIALAEAEKAAEFMRKRAEAEAEKKRLLDTFSKPSLSDEEAIRQGIAIIQRAAKNGQTEVQVFRFPNELCTDHGRAINQTEPGWESTLTERLTTSSRSTAPSRKVEMARFSTVLIGLTVVSRSTKSR